MFYNILHPLVKLQQFLIQIGFCILAPIVAASFLILLPEALEGDNIKKI
jgi:hypothetical protein